MAREWKQNEELKKMKKAHHENAWVWKKDPPPKNIVH
jgi:hypothetical protein